MGLGVMATINEVIDFDTAALVADEMGAKVEKEVIVTIEERLIDDSEDDNANTEERSPVVVVMGHVDHGKTSLLDRIRHANVTASEAGGITQHIGAYQVKVQDKMITFLDTPGHEAFTSMRARGADITDIAILVVAADDGIMPQTIESINHAKAANVSIVVAVNKMDKEGANVDRIKQELTEHGLVVEEWGGDIMCVPVSAKTGEGIDELLEDVQLIAEMKELKANPDRLAKGAVIEARLDKGRGPVATLLVQNGTLKTGDVIIAGTAVGKVRVMTDYNGNKINSAGPSVPVEITGLAEVPSAGDTFNAVEDEKLAKELVEQRKHEAKQEQFKAVQKVTLDNLFSQIAQGDVKELPIIVKADVQGSVEAVKQSLEKLSNEEVRVKVIHGGVGAVSEGDVMLASASNAIIVGFNVRPDPVAEESAKRDGVDIRLYRIIYDAIEEITTAMKGMLAPKFREVILGKAEVRQVYKISNVGALVAGFAAGYIILGLRKACEKLPEALEKIAPVLIYPVVGILAMGLLMLFIVEPIMGTVNTVLNNGLASMGGSSKLILGMILGGMMAIDMGGPFNKAAYVFGTAAIAAGNYDIMASVMIGGMVPPCAIALATLLFKDKFTKEERESGPTNFIMGLAFITEGAIPFAAADPIHVLPACIIGSGLAGALSMAFGCTLMAPHGGIFVVPVMGNALLYLVAVVIGTVVSAVLLGVLKKKVA